MATRRVLAIAARARFWMNLPSPYGLAVAGFDHGRPGRRRADGPHEGTAIAKRPGVFERSPGHGRGGVATSRILPSATAKGSSPARRTARSVACAKSNIAYRTTSDLP
jgi:hypothetical protein